METKSISSPAGPLKQFEFKVLIEESSLSLELERRFIWGVDLQDVQLCATRFVLVDH